MFDFVCFQRLLEAHGKFLEVDLKNAELKSPPESSKATDTQLPHAQINPPAPLGVLQSPSSV